MKYFKFDLLDKESEWEKNGIEYSKLFDKIKPSLSEEFLEIYFAEQGFHDKAICKMVVIDIDTLVVELLNSDGAFVKITYSGVKDFKLHNINKVCKSRQIGELLEWAYDEFSESDEMLTHSVLTSCGLEFEVSFKSIRAVYTDQELKAEGTILYL